MSIGSCNCKKDPADRDKNKIHPVVNATTHPPVSNPPTTNPPVSNPPTTNPPVSNPPTTNPPVSNLPTTNPPVSNPPTTNPPVSNPPTTNPPVSNPPTTNPPVSNPPTTNPPVSNPPTTNPPVSNPPTTNPPTTNLASNNPTPTLSSNSTDDSTDIEEDTKSKSILPPTSNPPTANSTTSDPTTSNPPTSNFPIPNSNSTSPSSSSSTDDSSDSEEDAKSKSTPLPPLQNLPTRVNNNKPADNSSAMPITDEMIQTLRASSGSDEGKRANRRAFADRLEGIKNGTVQVGTANDLYTLFDGSKCHLIFAAIMTDRVDILEALVESGASVVPVTSKGENALNAACRYGKLEAVKFLFTVERLKSFIWTRSVYGKNTNLMAAVKSKNLAVVEYVWNETLSQPGGKLFFEADKQADINETTPLLQAKADGSQAIVNFLVSKGFTV